jgi:hypothetical protein
MRFLSKERSLMVNIIMAGRARLKKYSCIGFFVNLLLVVNLSILTSGCGSPKITQKDISINVLADGASRKTDLPAGTTVQKALDSLGINLGSLDKVEPPTYTVLNDGSQINVVRVREEFITEQEIIPYSQQILKSETVQQGESRIIQSGVNGFKEITYRLVYENGVNTLKSPIKEPVVQPAIPEIVMIGVQSPYSPLSIPGKLAFYSSGNAWIFDGSTSARYPLVTTGDLDGRIFTLSPDANWLLFSRKSTKPADQEVNTLWVVSTNGESQTPLNLKVSNVVHFAAWIPSQPTTIAYSTVEPRNTTPVWQANNDLYTLTFSPSGWTTKPKLLVAANSGGSLGWWGTNFVWSPNGEYLAYARPDEVGLVDLEENLFHPLISITSFETHQDWAWIPQISWGADNSTLFVTNHSPSINLFNEEESQLFGLTAISMIDDINIQLVPKSGMYTNPACSQILARSTDSNYRVAFLQAIFPEQSATSRYRLVLMDRDGSNRQVIFPPEGLPGIVPQVNSLNIEPQGPVWAPESNSNNAEFIAILYQGDIWLIDTSSDFSQQITGDGLIERMDWK